MTEITPGSGEREEQESSKDAIGPIGPQQVVLLSSLQPYGLIFLHFQYHATCGHLEEAEDLVTEVHHLLLVETGFAPHDVDAEVTPGRDMVGEVVDARVLAGEFPCQGIILVVDIDEALIKADRLFSPGRAWGHLPYGKGRVAICLVFSRVPLPPFLT